NHSRQKGTRCSVPNLNFSCLISTKTTSTLRASVGPRSTSVALEQTK
ncbi:unnamed protein product, partial [Rotaria socialis]